MNKRLKSSLSLAIAAAMMTSPAAFAYDQTDAIEDCQDKIFDDSQYSRYSSPHGATAQETGRNSYKVTGLVKDRDKKRPSFQLPDRSPRGGELERQPGRNFGL
jgi:hypothetical protein